MGTKLSAPVKVKPSEKGILPEISLVVALLRWPLPASSIPGIRDLLAKGVDWDRLMKLAAHWQVEAVAYSNLSNHFAADLPGDVLETLRAREKASRSANVARTFSLAGLAKKFEEQGIETIVLKGPSLGIAAFGDISLRAFGDIDLLVKRNDLAVARDFLLSRGYERLYAPADEMELIRARHAMEFSKSGSKVELHWDLLSYHLAVPFDIDELWQSSHMIECAGGSIRVLSSVNQFVFICAHGAKHEWLNVRWIVDAAQLASRLTAQEVGGVMELAARLRCVRVVSLGLGLATDAVGPFVSAFGSDRLRAQNATSRLISEVKAQVGLGPSIDAGVGLRFGRVHPNLKPLVFWLRCRENRKDQFLIWARFLSRRLHAHSQRLQWHSPPG